VLDKGAMATENIVLLGSAVILCTLHLIGGPLSGLVRRPRTTKRATQGTLPSRSSTPSLSAEVPPPLSASEKRSSLA
jgi:hypothetical protein